MTNEEAIYALKNTAWLGSDKDREATEEAVNMAIEALQQVTGKLRNPDDSLLTEDTEDSKKQKGKLDLISRQDAIDAWWHDEVFFGNQRDDMTKEQWLDYITDIIGSLPSEVVMCKDCKWWNGNTETMHNNHLCRNWSKFGSIDVGADDFCSYGERREP